MGVMKRDTKMKIDGHLTESKLGELLTYVYGENNVVGQYKLDKYKIDFYIKPTNTFVEFDGFRHFNCYATITRDKLVEKLIHESEAHLIRVPYFIQAKTVLQLLKSSKAIEQDYPDGFISPKALKPRDFSRKGHNVFVDFLQNLPACSRSQIIETLELCDF